MFCNFCGAQIEGDSEFCSRCGAKLKKAVTPKLTGTPKPMGTPNQAESGLKTIAPTGQQRPTAQPRPTVQPNQTTQPRPAAQPSQTTQPRPAAQPKPTTQPRPTAQTSPQSSPQTASTPQYYQRPEKKTAGNAVIILASVCSVLFLSVIGLVIFIIAGKGKDKSEATSAEASTTIEAAAEEEKQTEETKENVTEVMTEAVTEAATEAEPAAEEKVSSNGVELFEMRNGILVVQGDLFGRSYDEIKTYVESLGYRYDLDVPMDWEYSDIAGVKSNYINIDDRHSLGLYFYEDILVCFILEEKGYSNIKELEVRASSLYGALNSWEIHDEDTGEIIEFYVDYNANSATVGDTMEGTYAIFQNNYDDGTYTEFRDQQVLSTKRYPGKYINPNYVYDFK